MKKKIVANVLVSAMLCSGMSIPVYAEEHAGASDMKEGGVILESICEERTNVLVADAPSITEGQKEDFEQYCDIYYEIAEQSEEGNLYPDYISGVYYDEMQGVVVEVTEENDFIEKLSEKWSGGITIEYVEHSYNELNKLKERIASVCEEILLTENSELEELVVRINSIAIDEEKNSVKIGITNLTKDDEEKFRKCIMDSDMVTFYEYGEIDECAATTVLKPGMRIFNENASG